MIDYTFKTDKLYIIYYFILYYNNNIIYYIIQSIPKVALTLLKQFFIETKCFFKLYMSQKWKIHVLLVLIGFCYICARFILTVFQSSRSENQTCIIESKIKTDYDISSSPLGTGSFKGPLMKNHLWKQNRVY